MAMYRRRDQQAAAFAFNVVAINPTDEYRSLVRKLPAMLAMCRLPATVTFLQAKEKGEHAEGKGAHADILDHLSKWLYEQDDASGAFGQKHADLVTGIREADSTTLRQMERSVARIATWLKRAAEVNSQAGAQGGPGTDTVGG